MPIIIGTLECTDPGTGEQRMIAAVSGSPQEAMAVYQEIRPHLNPALFLAPPVELPPKCTCVVPRLYAYARANDLTVHGMTLIVYETGKPIEPCRYCRKNSDSILAGVRIEPRSR